MAQVSLKINGFSYPLGCADGEEAHLTALAADLDRRIEEIKVTAGPSGEARLLLMAALTIADEMHDLRQQTGTDSAAPRSRPDPKLGRRLGRIAKRAEDIAGVAEASPDPSPVHPDRRDTEAPQAENPPQEFIAASPDRA